jgi:hypothetical protein
VYSVYAFAVSAFLRLATFILITEGVVLGGRVISVLAIGFKIRGF